MVVSHLRRIKHALGFLQRFAANGFDIFCIDGHSTKLGLIKAVQRLWTFGVDVVREILRIHTRVGGKFPFVECLDKVISVRRVPG